MVFGFIFLIFFLAICVLSLGLTVLQVISLWKLFVKAGKPGWYSIIPIYNVFVIANLGETNIIWPIINVASPIVSFLMTFGITFGLEVFKIDANYDVAYASTSLLSMCLTVLVYVANFVMMINFAKKYGKDGVFGVGIVLVPFVFLPWLAFDKNTKYNGSIKTTSEKESILCTNCGELNKNGTRFCTNCGEELN